MTTGPRAFGQQLAGLAGSAFRSFIGTFAVVLLAGMVLAGISFGYVNRYSTGYALLAGGLAIVEAAAAGIFLAGHRAVLSAAARGLETFHLGGTVVRMIFDRIGGSAGGVMHVPLAQAEEFLNRAVEGVLGDPAAGDGLRRKIHGRLVNLISKYTLVRFREQNAEHGEIDVRKIRDELERTSDEFLVDRVRSARMAPTFAVAIGLPLLVLMQIWMIRTPAISSFIGGLRDADRFELLSIEPMDYGEGPDRFHKFRVLGITSIDDHAIRGKLVDALNSAMNASGEGVKCYYPRHAIRATHDNQTIEFGICFECKWLYIYSRGDDIEEFVIDNEQQTFDEVLREAGVPLAKPARNTWPPNQTPQPGGTN